MAIARTFPSWGCGPTEFWVITTIWSRTPVNSPYNNFLVAAAEAMGSRSLAAYDPERADRSRKMAESDWHFAVASLQQASRTRAATSQWLPLAVLASVELWKLTGDPQYRDEALTLAPTLVDSQQKSLMPWKRPLTGFFYTSPQEGSNPALLPPRPRTGSHCGAGPALRGISRRRALDGLVLHRGAALRVS